MRLVAIAVALALSGCGGSGGAGSPAPGPVPPPPAARVAPLQFGYFGIADVATTASSVTFTHAVDWGTWGTDTEAIKQRIIAQLKACKAAGISAIMSTGFLTFTAAYAYIGTAELIAFKAQLDALELSQVVIALYPIDEPDVHGISDSRMTKCCADTRAAWPGPKLAVIYGTQGTPGISAYDWIGRDDYGAGAGVLNHLPQIRPDQQWIIVPGGADPWKQDPAPFVAFADAHHQVAVLMPFLYSDYAGGQGIGTNGMLPAYAAAGSVIKAST
jgi:hypothetical protein